MARSWHVRLVRRFAALVVAVASGCTWTYEYPPHGESTPGTPGPVYPAAPTAPAGWFDECSVLTTAELGEHLTVAVRKAKPEGRGWRLTCSYSADGPSAAGPWDVEVVIDTEVTQPFFTSRPELTTAADGSPLPHAVAEPVPDLGDQAYVLVNYTENDHGEIRPDSVQVNFRSEGHDVRLIHQTWRPEATVESTIRLARQVDSRIPSTPRVRPRLISGPCAAVDLRLAGQILGDELIGARQVLDPSGHVLSCEFTGRLTTLSIDLDSRADALETFDAKRSVGTRIPDVGEDAYRPFEDAPLTFVEIKVGRQIVMVSGWTSDGEDPPESDSNRLLRAIADELS